MEALIQIKVLEILAVCNDPGLITHGKKDGNDFSHGKHVKYKCDGNYSLEGNHQLTCHDGQWNSDPPLCKGKLSLNRETEKKPMDRDHVWKRFDFKLLSDSPRPSLPFVGDFLIT